MSGGHFDYRNDNLCHDIYGWGIYPDYGDRGFEQSKLARQLDPLDDIVMSELVFDVFCVLHSYDWYQSGDTGEDDYRADVQRFKNKWLTPMSDDYIKIIIDDEITVLRERLSKSLILGTEEPDNPCTT